MTTPRPALSRGRYDADMAATRRSILRYLSRYEREWGHPVSVYAWEMIGCTPPEEDPHMRAILAPGRTRVALGQMVHEGLLDRRRARDGRRFYSLTEVGRAA